MKHLLHCTIFLIIFLSRFTVLAGPVDDQRVSEIENKIRQIEKTYLDNNKDIASAVNKAESLVQQSAGLEGKIETNQHMLESQRKEFLTLLREMEFRISALEQRLQIFSQQLSKALTKVAPEVAKEGELYQKALDKVTSGHYLEAITNFNQFLKSYPKSDFRADAMYWIGECHFAMKEHTHAIKSFQAFIDKYPKNKEVPSAIFKQGNSFVELGFEDDAKVFYKKVISDFPQSDWAEKAKQRIEQLELKSKISDQEIIQPLSSYPSKTIVEQKDSSLKEVDLTTKPKSTTSKDENKTNVNSLPSDAKPISSMPETNIKPADSKTQNLPRDGF